MPTGILTWSIVSRSRTVTVWGSSKLSKSIVMPYGMAISSARAYRRPIVPFDSSTLWKTPCSVNAAATVKSHAQCDIQLIPIPRPIYSQISRMNGSNSWFLVSGSTEHFSGAITGGNEKYLYSLPMRVLKLCSRRAYIMRPMPNDGSMTLGLTSSTCNDFFVLLMSTISLSIVNSLLPDCNVHDLTILN